MAYGIYHSMNTLTLHGSTEIPTAVLSIRVPAILCDIQHGLVIDCMIKMRYFFYLPVFITTNINKFLQEKRQAFCVKTAVTKRKAETASKPGSSYWKHCSTTVFDDGQKDPSIHSRDFYSRWCNCLCSENQALTWKSRLWYVNYLSFKLLNSFVVQSVCGSSVLSKAQSKKKKRKKRNTSKSHYLCKLKHTAPFLAKPVQTCFKCPAFS